MQNKVADIFEYESVAKVLVLCILTVGIYLIVKLYQYSQRINRYTEYKIPSWFIATAIFLFGVSFASLIHVFMNLNSPEAIELTIVIHAISTLFDVTWIIMVRNRINRITATKRGERMWLNPFITSILHVIYMQYVINQGRQQSS
ncbi:hypothetical protein MHM98_04920 [Psychrobium sp. MM17-31]|uniref:hypothetical protein n=1 Tax=Psychrobium sp. MM17-31 TaxID=2917758 RepID=UPI001EF58EE6|nr:hypothetical protein [Psychrobium sp. MM17-31]MCG7530700.1 hypothetical protein [Psychrobium sp. MM17-31]